MEDSNPAPQCFAEFGDSFYLSRKYIPGIQPRQTMAEKRTKRDVKIRDTVRVQSPRERSLISSKILCKYLYGTGEYSELNFSSKSEQKVTVRIPTAAEQAAGDKKKHLDRKDKHYNES